MSSAVEPAARPAVARTPANADVEPWLVPLSAIAPDPDVDAAVAETIRSGWWSTGPRVAEFERRFASLCGHGEAIAVANGTAALHLALLALGCGPGDEVILPSLNFVAAANVIGHVGAVPVFCDVCSEDDLTIDPVDLEAAITPRTSAIVVMHYGGHPCRMDEILEVACRHRLAVIEDAAHAPGATLAGRMCGTFGDVGCFSFFSNKNLPTGEGGMVVTGDPDLADRLRLLRSHGMTTLSWDRHRGHAQSYDVLVPGFNFRMDDVRAAIGTVHLRRLLESNAARGRIVAAYRDALDGYRGIRMPFPERDDATPAYHLAVLVLPKGGSRDAFRAKLTATRIQTSVHYPPTHRLAWYRAHSRPRKLPVTDAVAARLVTLPLYPHMGDARIRAVIEAVRRPAR